MKYTLGHVFVIVIFILWVAWHWNIWCQWLSFNSSIMKWILSVVLIFWTVSMVMFSTFEHSVDFLYRNVVKRKKEDCSIGQQLGVTCLAGYAAGSVGSFISNPADNIVSSLYNRKADSLALVFVSLQFCLWYFLER